MSEAQSTSGVVVYTGPITLSKSGTTSIQVYASETGYSQSNYVSALYTLVLPPTATPAISLAAGYYSGPQTATITDSAAGAKIYYTTNGTFPAQNSNLYSGPITVSSSETLVASAIAFGYSFSPAASAQYVIGGSSASLIYTVAGTGSYGYTGNGGPTTLAELNFPNAVVKDGARNLYLSDSGNHMVRKVAAGTGIISIVAGTGTVGYSGDGGAAASAELSSPDSLALDALGDLFIVDSDNGTIRKVNLTSGIITTYAGNPTATAPGDGGQATAASLGFIGGIAIDASRNIFIADGDRNTIREVNDGTGIITTIAGIGTSGFSGDGGPASNATFNNSSGLAFDASGNLYIADRGNNVVRKVTASKGIITGTDFITTAAGTGSGSFGKSLGGYAGDGGPATSALLNSPIALASDHSGNLYISDSNNSVIRLVTAGTGIISTVAGNAMPCGSYGGDGGIATGASLCYPFGITVDNAGNLYIADEESNRVRVALAPGTPPSTQAAAPQFSVSAGTYPSIQSVTISDTTPGASIYVSVNGETPTTAQSPGYSFPIEVAGVVKLGAIATAPGYLTSEVSSATYTITSFAPTITTVAGNGTPGFSGFGGPALSAEFGVSQGVAVDKAGNVYLSDSRNNVVWMISATTGAATLFAGNGTSGYAGDGGAATSATLNNPQGIALDSAGNLYIADASNSVVRKVTASTGVISSFAGGYNSSGANSGDGGPATSASLSFPTAVAVDGSNNVYIADTIHYTIREVSAATGVITTVAGNGSYGFSGDGGPATKAGLQPPNGLAVDNSANLYIVSSGAGRIRKVMASTGVISTVAGVGDIEGNTGDGGQATKAEIARQSISVDSSGNLYFSSWPGEIREVNAGTGVITKVAGIGFTGFSGDGGAAAVAELLGPTGMAFDSAGNLFFADAYNYRVRKVTFTQLAAATPVFSVGSGTYPSAQSVSITDATPGATIYYTSDGTGPTTASTVYSGPITVSSSETIKAIAVAVGYNTSAVASAAYVINIPVPKPSLSSLSPAFASAGGAAFAFTVNGASFTASSAIYWGATALTTQYVSATQLTSQVPTSNIASAGITSITVQTPAPGGGTSNALQFEVDTAGSATPPAFSKASATVTAGATATYGVTLPSSATNISVACLNLPAAAACSYSAGAGTLTITTTSSTPAGTYEITAVFTETLPGAAAALALLPFLLLPFAGANKRKSARLRIIAGVGLVLAVLAAGAGCGGGGGGSSPTPPQTHQVTSSGTVTLIVK
jgi:sugar lactone lactonase YvrE